MDLFAELRIILNDLGLEGDSITLETQLRAGLGVDSTDLVAIGMAVEKHMPFPVDTVSFPALESIAEMVEVMQQAQEFSVPQQRPDQRIARDDELLN